MPELLFCGWAAHSVLAPLTKQLNLTQTIPQPRLSSQMSGGCVKLISKTDYDWESTDIQTNFLSLKLLLNEQHIDICGLFYYNGLNSQGND